jgi:pimeloyl-ACP methyl ester carboxylesterase
MATFESISGKYVNFKVQGVDYRVYFEENGEGIPLVCQHTAGSDGRQWRHLMNDKDIISKYRVIVPDLPYHGKSLPPESVAWWKEEYKLTKSFFLDFHMEFCKVLNLEKPVYIGCSMGGYLAPDLALEHPELYSTVIGIQSNQGCGPVAADAQLKVMDYFYHPAIGNDYKATAMRDIAAPESPEKYKWETAWEYSQGAPPVFRGDLYYHIKDHDMTDGRAQKIDTSMVAVYFLTGEYDGSCTPEETKILADQIKGCKFTPMKGLGHFAMCENYPALRKYLMPVLDEIAKNRT